MATTSAGLGGLKNGGKVKKMKRIPKKKPTIKMVK